MAEQLITFAGEELCTVGYGEKYHIRAPSLPANLMLTYCRSGPISNVPTSIIRVREDYSRLCKRCIRAYKTRAGIQEKA